MFLVLLLTALLPLAFSARTAPPPHPRLILTPSRLADVKAFIANDTQASAYYAALRAQGEAVLARAPLPRPPANASDILGAARAVLVRTYVTSLLWRLERNVTWAARAAAELLSFTSWSDWDINKHALDTGELSHAAAIGYDWIYDFLNDTEKAVIAAGLVAKGLVPFRTAYEQRGDYSWTCASSNWACVTNGGAGLGALALLGDAAAAPAWLPALLANATAGVRCSAAVPPGDGTGGGYANDGAWWEGPIYHGYASRYVVPFAASLETAAVDTSLWELPGVSLAAHYQMTALDTNYSYFNWADAEEGQETLANLLSVAARAGDGAAAWTLRDRLDASNISLEGIDTGSQDAMEFSHALIYFTPIGARTDRAALPLDTVLPAKRVAFLRESWTAAGATFVGVKGCNCSWNHGDLDAGSFVYSNGGVRWAADLGADNYALPSYFGSKRFEYYRKNSRGHNVLSFDGALHDAADCFSSQANATSTYISSFASSSGSVAPGAPPGHAVGTCALSVDEAACVEIDTGAAFAMQGVARALRRFALSTDRKTLTVTDSWALGGTGADPHNATTAVHTHQDVVVAADARSAVLSAGSARVVLRIAGDAPCAASARVTATPVRLAPPQYSTPGLTRIDVTVDAACGGVGVTLGPE